VRLGLDGFRRGPRCTLRLRRLLTLLDLGQGNLCGGRGRFRRSVRFSLYFRPPFALIRSGHSGYVRGGRGNLRCGFCFRGWLRAFLGLGNGRRARLRTRASGFLYAQVLPLARRSTRRAAAGVVVARFDRLIRDTSRDRPGLGKLSRRCIPAILLQGFQALAGHELIVQRDLDGACTGRGLSMHRTGQRNLCRAGLIRW
jgi:hypothetical protein